MGPFQRLAGSAVAATLILLAGGSVQAEVSLVDAVRNRDAAAIRTLLQNRADVNAPGADGATPLHWAAYVDDAETVSALLTRGANVKAVNRHGVTPLSLAAINGNVSIIELLLKAGADPNTSTAGGETVLMTAARTGKVEAVKVLIQHGADVNAKETARGQTALMWAAAEGNADVIQVLTAGKADLRARSLGGFSALLFAVREGRLNAVRALLKAGADVNEKTLPPPTARRKPAGQADSGEPAGGTSALVLAVANAHFELAAELLDAKADPNAAEQGWSALHQITWVRNPGYGDNKPGPQGSGGVNSLDLVRRLVAAGANVNARMTQKAEMGTTALNNVGATAFLLAARAADTELMHLLVDLGADPLLPNAANVTPLLAAAGVGTHSPGEDAGTEADAVAAVKFVLDLGGDINGVDSNGDSAMHGAAYKQFPAVVRLLAERGARPEIWNQKNQSGWAPLTIAEGVQRGNNIRSSAATAAAIRQALNSR